MSWVISYFKNIFPILKCLCEFPIFRNSHDKNCYSDKISIGLVASVADLKLKNFLTCLTFSGLKMYPCTEMMSRDTYCLITEKCFNKRKKKHFPCLLQLVMVPANSLVPSVLNSHLSVQLKYGCSWFQNIIIDSGSPLYCIFMKITTEACKSCSRLPVTLSLFSVKKKSSSARMAHDNLNFHHWDCFQIMYVLSSTWRLLDLQRFTMEFWSLNMSVPAPGRSFFSLCLNFIIMIIFPSVFLVVLFFSDDDPCTNAEVNDTCYMFQRIRLQII